jgi:hypothetical protein
MDQSFASQNRRHAWACPARRVVTGFQGVTVRNPPSLDLSMRYGILYMVVQYDIIVILLVVVVSREGMMCDWWPTPILGVILVGGRLFCYMGTLSAHGRPDQRCLPAGKRGPHCAVQHRYHKGSVFCRRGYLKSPAQPVGNDRRRPRTRIRGEAFKQPSSLPLRQCSFRRAVDQMLSKRMICRSWVMDLRMEGLLGPEISGHKGRYSWPLEW